MLEEMRKKLVKKLLRPNDGYTFTGFSGEEPIKFYYQEDTGRYLLGGRSENWYYHEPTLSGWSACSSKYLPWGQTVERALWNPKTKEMESWTYNQEPHEIDFQKWIYHIFDQVHNEYIEEIMSLTSEELHDKQDRIKKINKKYQEKNEKW